MAECNEIDRGVQALEARIQKKRQEQENIALAHPVFGQILTRHNRDIRRDLISDFINCAKDFTLSAKTEDWEDSVETQSDQEKLYKGFLGKIVLGGGLKCGLMRPLAEALLGDDRLTDNDFQFNILFPLLRSYRHASLAVNDQRGNFVAITKDDLAAMDSSNGEISNFVSKAYVYRPGFVARSAINYEVAQRCAYSVPGRVTEYHARLGRIILGIDHAELYSFQMAQLYAMSLNVVHGEDWGGHPKLALEIEKKFGRERLIEEVKNAHFSVYNWDAPVRKRGEPRPQGVVGLTIAGTGR